MYSADTHIQYTCTHSGTNTFSTSHNYMSGCICKKLAGVQRFTPLQIKMVKGYHTRMYQVLHQQNENMVKPQEVGYYTSLWHLCLLILTRFMHRPHDVTCEHLYKVYVTWALLTMTVYACMCACVCTCMCVYSVSDVFDKYVTICCFVLVFRETHSHLENFDTPSPAIT